MSENEEKGGKVLSPFGKVLQSALARSRKVRFYRDLAEASDVPYATITSYLKDVRTGCPKPTIDTVLKLAEGLGMSLDEMFRHESEEFRRVRRRKEHLEGLLRTIQGNLDGYEAWKKREAEKETLELVRAQKMKPRDPDLTQGVKPRDPDRAWHDSLVDNP